MELKKIICLVCFAFLYSSSSFCQQTVDPYKSRILFTVTNLKIEVEGQIRGISGNIKFDENDLNNSLFEVKIPTKSIRTGNKMRDEHLREEEFFYVKKYPDIKFQSTNISKIGEEFMVTRELKIKGVSKSIKFPFKVENEIFKGNFIINRNDFNVGGNGFLDTIGDSVFINISCSVKQ